MSKKISDKSQKNVLDIQTEIKLKYLKKNLLTKSQFLFKRQNFQAEHFSI